MTIVHEEKFRWKITHSISFPTSFSVCQPVGTMPACSHGILEAIKAIGVELLVDDKGTHL